MAEKYPEKVVEVLRLLVEHRVADHGYYGWVDKAGDVLAKLLKTPVKDSATKIIHRIGALGFSEIGKLLE